MGSNVAMGLMWLVAVVSVLAAMNFVPCSSTLPGEFTGTCGAILLNASIFTDHTSYELHNVSVRFHASMDVNISQVAIYFSNKGAQPRDLVIHNEATNSSQRPSSYGGGLVSLDVIVLYYYTTFSFSPEAQLSAGSSYLVEFVDFPSPADAGGYADLRLADGSASNSDSLGLVFSSSATINGAPMAADNATSLVVPSLAVCGSARAPTPSPTPSLTPSPTSTPTATPTPTSTPSPSALPKLVVATNVSADFANSSVAFNMSASFASANNTSSSSSTSSTSVRSDLVEVQVGNLSVPAASLANLTRTAVNDSALGTSGVTYSALLPDASSRFEQTLALFTRDTETSFAGVSFAVGANSVKWTLNLTSEEASSSTTSGHASEWSVVRYRLSSVGLLAGANTPATAISATPAKPIVRTNTPTVSQTTYLLPLFATTTRQQQEQRQEVVMASVVLFDVALVDGESVTPIRHSIVAVNQSQAAAAEVNEYEVVLELPPFNVSLVYDPSVSLGLLVGATKDGSGGGSGSDNMAVIVGVAVAVPVAVGLVLLVVTVGAAVVWWQRRHMHRNVRGSVNFSAEDDL